MIDEDEQSASNPALKTEIQWTTIEKNDPSFSARERDGGSIIQDQDLRQWGRDALRTGGDSIEIRENGMDEQSLDEVESGQPADSGRRHVTQSSSRNQLVKQSHKRQNAAIIAGLNGSAEEPLEESQQTSQLMSLAQAGQTKTTVNKIELLEGRNHRMSSTIDILNQDEQQQIKFGEKSGLEGDLQASNAMRVSQTNPKNTIEDNASEQDDAVDDLSHNQNKTVVCESKGLSTLRAQIQ